MAPNKLPIIQRQVDNGKQKCAPPGLLIRAPIGVLILICNFNLCLRPGKASGRRPPICWQRPGVIMLMIIKDWSRAPVAGRSGAGQWSGRANTGAARKMITTINNCANSAPSGRALTCCARRRPECGHKSARPIWRAPGAPCQRRPMSLARISGDPAIRRSASRPIGQSAPPSRLRNAARPAAQLAPVSPVANTQPAATGGPTPNAIKPTGHADRSH